MLAANANAEPKVWRPHRPCGPVQTLRTEQVDVILPSHQQPTPVLVQQQDLVAPADPGLPEHRRPVPQIWNEEQSSERSLFLVQIKPDDGSNIQGLKKIKIKSVNQTVYNVSLRVSASLHEPDWSSWRTFGDETWLKAAN